MPQVPREAHHLHQLVLLVYAYTQHYQGYCPTARTNLNNLTKTWVLKWGTNKYQEQEVISVFCSYFGLKVKYQEKEVISVLCSYFGLKVKYQEQELLSVLCSYFGLKVKYQEQEVISVLCSYFGLKVKYQNKK